VTGRYVFLGVGNRRDRSFQSSPGLVTGRYLDSYRGRVRYTPVSILARSGDRALPPNGQILKTLIDVSILARSGDRALRYCSAFAVHSRNVSILARSGDRALLYVTACGFG